MKKLIEFTICLTLLAYLVCTILIIFTMFLESKTLFNTLIIICCITILLNLLYAFLIMLDLYKSKKNNY